MFLTFLKYSFLTLITFVLLLALISIFFHMISKSSNERDWEFGQQKIQKVFFDNDSVLIKDLRDYNWKEKGSEEKYKDFSFDLSQIEGVEVGVSHFSPRDYIAHVFIVFNLKDSEDIALSIEARREEGQEFTILGGLKFDYEIAYFLTTKKDLIDLRENRKEDVYLYPTTADAKVSQELFRLISKRVNSLYDKPEKYHLFFRNCTNLIAQEIEKISDNNFPFLEKTFTPGYADKVLFEMNLLDTDLNNFDEVKKKFLIKFD